MIIGEAQILIEPDDQYATQVTSTDTETGIKLSISAVPNQTLGVAFNKIRDDLATLLTGNLKVRTGTIKVTIS